MFPMLIYRGLCEPASFHDPSILALDKKQHQGGDRNSSRLGQEPSHSCTVWRGAAAHRKQNLTPEAMSSENMLEESTNALCSYYLEKEIHF